MSILQCATHLDAEERPNDDSKRTMHSNSWNSYLIYIKLRMYLRVSMINIFTNYNRYVSFAKHHSIR